MSRYVTLRHESVRGRADSAHLGFATLGFAYHLVICCTDNIVDGVVSPALIASDSIWAVAEKALHVDRSVRFGSVRFRRVRFSSFCENERAVKNGYKEVDMTPEHIAALHMFQLGASLI